MHRAGIQAICHPAIMHPMHKDPELAPRGEKNAAAKLTEADVVAIRAAWDAGGVTLAALGARYGVAKGTINFIAKRKTWRHVPEQDDTAA